MADSTVSKTNKVESAVVVHTPGPWYIDPTLQRGRDGGKYGYREVNSRRSAFWVAKVQAFSDDPTGEYGANARLIAAAPDLLAACKALQMEARARKCGLRIADEAIAKAEGR